MSRKLSDLSNDEKRRILRIGTEGIDNLVGDEYDLFKELKENQRQGVPNFNTPAPTKYADGGMVGSSGTIRIEIDLGGVTGNEGYEMQDEDVCPVATYDEDLNAENRAVAEDDYAYGDATATWENKNAKCGTCKYFNMTERMLDCIGSDEDVGYSEALHFVCSAEKVCNMWELGVPKSEMNPSDDGNSRDIF